jgi:putative selenium metabolism protein SsnA
MILTNARVLTFDEKNRVIDRGNVEIREDGSIGGVGTDRSSSAAGPDESIDLGGRVLMPALINCHTHLYSTFARGLILGGRRPTNFPTILKNLWWRLDCALNEEDIYYSALIGLLESAKCGVATVVDHHSSPKACSGSLAAIERAFEKVGLRGTTCYETSDRNGTQAALDGIRENVRFLESRRPGKLVSGAFGLHASFTLSDRTLRACVDANRGVGAGFHVHVAEDKVDQGAVQRLESFGMLDGRTVAAHCIHLNAADRRVLAERGVNVVHNPNSNCTNAVGTANAVPGVLTGLGTDGISPRIWDELKTSLGLQKLRERDPRAGCPDLFLNNRAIVKKVWGFDVGRIESGARADLMVADYFPPTPVHTGNVFSHLLFGISNAPVDSLMVNGLWVLRAKQLVTLDEARVAQKAAARAKAIWERL